MSRYSSILCLLLLPVWLLAHEGPRVKPSHNPHYFIENKGQWEENILFKAEIPQGNVLVTKEGLVYQLVAEEMESSSRERSNRHGHSHKDQRLKGQVVKVSFQNSHYARSFDKQNPIEAQFQYLIGKNNLKQHVRAYQKINLELYKGIDLTIYFEKSLLKYDFHVSPHADASQIKLIYEGADSLKIEEGHLVIHTSLGKVYEKPPYSYQIKRNGIKEIPCAFQLNKNQISFQLPSGYDKNISLVIDPELIFSTYSGSHANNFGNTATYDDEGHLYSGGIVFGNSQLPIVPGPFEAHSGKTDCYILKFSPDGKKLLAAAYIGGSEVEFPISMIVNRNKELLILGVTGSPDFPVTSTAFDTTFKGGPDFDAFTDPNYPYATQYFNRGSDIFITRINSVDFSLLSSTFLGGRDNDGVSMSKTDVVKNYGDQLRGEIMIDSVDNVYIATQTYSDSISHVPHNGVEYLQNHGLQDALIVKLSPDLSKVNWLRFLGGDNYDSGFGIRVDDLQQVYVTGGTSSPTIFPSSLGYRNTPYGATDGYIAKISSNGKTILSSTYLGTSAYDQCYFIDLDIDKDVYVVGQTQGKYPVTTGSYNNPTSGQFIHKFNNSLSTSIFSTVFGSGSGSPDISLTAFLVNNCKKIFISGWGGSTNSKFDTIPCYNPDGSWYWCPYDMGYVGGNTKNMPITKDGYQKVSNGNGFYFIIFHPDAKSLAYATHFGGLDGTNREHVDGGTSRFDKKGIIYQSVCAGCEGFSNFPTPIPGVWSTTNKSSKCNNAALKFDLGKVVADFSTIDSLVDLPSVYGCVPITFLLKNKSSGATNYKWEIEGETAPEIFTRDDSIFVKFKTRGLKNLTLIAYDTSICRLVDTARAVINAGDVRADFPKDRINCGLLPFTADLKLYTPWAKVKWEPATGLSDPTIPNPIVTPTAGGITYTITVNDDTLCTKVDTFRVQTRMFDPKAEFKVFDSLKIQEKYTFCFPSTGFFKSYSTDYDTLWWEENNAPIYAGVDSFYHTFSQLGKIKYKLHVLDTACKKTDDEEKLVIVSFPNVTYPSDVMLCPDSSALVKVVGEAGNTYVWSPAHLFSDPTAEEQRIHPDSSGTVYIYVTDSIGCKTNGSFRYGNFTVPNAIPDREGKICYKKVPGVDIKATELKEYNWLPSGYTSNPLYVTSEGKYILIGRTFDGCPVKDSILVLHKCDPEIHVPDAFSPDGDGRNDYFQVFGHEVTTFDIKIFDRWGELIYHSTDFRFHWDGTYRNQTVPIGTYPYVITYSGTTFEGEKVGKTLSGDVTVVK